METGELLSREPAIRRFALSVRTRGANVCAPPPDLASQARDRVPGIIATPARPPRFPSTPRWFVRPMRPNGCLAHQTTTPGRAAEPNHFLPAGFDRPPSREGRAAAMRHLISLRLTAS